MQIGLTSSKALRLRPVLARLGELCRVSGVTGVVPFGVILTSAGMLCISLLNCCSNLATWTGHRNYFPPDDEICNLPKLSE